MILDFTNKVALVTASSKGLGYATALELARSQAKVIICGRNQYVLQDAIQNIINDTENNNVTGICADVTKIADLHIIYDHIYNQYGTLDILITNIGMPKLGNFDKLITLDWEQASNGLLISVVNLIKIFLPLLRNGNNSSILTMTSLSGKQPQVGSILSSVFRTALIALTKSLAQELGPENIRVNSILPGWVGTEHTYSMIEKISLQNNLSKEQQLSVINNTIALQRMATPTEFAYAALFLVSSAASYLTGVMLPVDGGAYKGLL